MIVGLAFTPALVKRFGIYRVNKYGMVFSVIFGAVFVAVCYTKSLPLMLAASAIPAIICVLMLLVVSGLNIQ